MTPTDFLVFIVDRFLDVILLWGWLFVLFLAMWIAWEVYRYLKHVDYVSSINWTFYQVKLPDEAGQTPKALENAIEVWGGMHKDPDVIERLFEGYFLAWFSLELQCMKDHARYIVVVPTPHSKFIEGVLYGQYPTAEVTEVEDYSLTFSYEGIEKTFSMWGSEIILVKDDIYPIRTYIEFEDKLNEDDTYVDPHQAMVEAFTNIQEDEHFWVQVLVKPIDAKDIAKWSEKGQERIAELSGQAPKEAGGILAGLTKLFTKLPGELLRAALSGPLEPEDMKDEGPNFKFYNPAEDAEMRGILQKISRSGFKTKIRVLHFAPLGKLHKPNYGKAIGAFKQFNTWHLNSFKPDPVTKTNGPNYIFKQTRRRYRERHILVDYQFRDFWGDNSGDILTAEEIATVYHFPVKYLRSPSVRRASSGLSSPPENLPYT